MGVGDTVLAHRAEQHAGELSVPPAPDHDEIGPTGGIDQHRGGVALCDP
jgi:hypothetical protein